MLRKLTRAEISEIQDRNSDLWNYESPDMLDRIDPLTFKNPEGDTLLHIAALRGDFRTLSLLLDAGLDPNIVGDMGYTPLHYAGMQPNKAVAKLLIEHGARSDIANEFGTYPQV